MITTTLPINLKEGAVFTTLLAPFVAHLIAHARVDKLVIATNLTGMRSSTKTDPLERSEKYRSNLKGIGVEEYDFWNETLESYRNFFFQTLEKWKERGLLFETDEVMCLCPCGAVEIPSQYLDTFWNKKLYEKSGAAIMCRLCQSAAIFSRVRVLMFRFLDEMSMSPGCEPANHTSELHESINRIKGRIVPVSRSTRKNDFVWSGSKEFYLDTDFVWGMYLAHIAQLYDEKEITVVISNRVIEPFARCALIANMIYPEVQIGCVVYPILNPVSSRVEQPDKISIERFIDMFSVTSRRFYLGLALQWGRKEVVTDFAELHRAELALSEAVKSSDLNSLTLSELMFRCQRVKILSILAKLRKKKPLDEWEKSVCQLIFA